MVWGQLEMELAIVCASAPAMRGFLSAVADRATTTYDSRKYGSRSRVTGATNISDFSAPSIDQGTELYDGGVPLSSRWTEKSETYSGRPSDGDELLTVPEKKYTLGKGGIMVTETFSVDRDRGSWGYGRPARFPNKRDRSSFGHDRPPRT